ncbi:DNA alkylation repair protein [Candidatus Micrarchaeota archaeon]|nr:DNA alkylation repair protein [Candidatus Micrarchaeota archaeon]
MNQKKLVLRIGKTLQQKASPKIAAGSKHYFKETIQPRGIKLPAVRAFEKELWKELKNEIDLKQALGLTEALFETGYMEDPFLGMGMVRRFEKEFDAKTFSRFEKWVDRYITNWAHCDDLCAHLIAPTIKQNPVLVKKMQKWPFSPNRWKRRASIVSFVPLAGKGLFEKEIVETAEKLLSDQEDDLVHKGNGWVLRELGKHNKKRLLAFLKKHRSRIPRVTMRYALERTPKHLKKGL